MTIAISFLCIVSGVGFAAPEPCGGLCRVAGLGPLGASLHPWR